MLAHRQLDACRVEPRLRAEEVGGTAEVRQDVVSMRPTSEVEDTGREAAKRRALGNIHSRSAPQATRRLPRSPSFTRGRSAPRMRWQPVQRAKNGRRERRKVCHPRPTGYAVAHVRVVRDARRVHPAPESLCAYRGDAQQKQQQSEQASHVSPIPARARECQSILGRSRAQATSSVLNSKSSHFAQPLRTSPPAPLRNGEGSGKPKDFFPLPSQGRGPGG
jgi:hypothetical protein